MSSNFCKSAPKSSSRWSCKDAKPGSVVVTLSAANWADLHTANALIDQGGFELPSFGKFEKEQDRAVPGVV